MAEIRLICPGCAAEYRVPNEAIPAGGREVECSACGHVWHAIRQPGAIGPDPRPAERSSGGVPRLNRSLPDSVLDILRSEVEHERRARAAEATRIDPAPPAMPPVPAAAPPAPTLDEDPPIGATSRPVEPEKTGPGERGTTEAEPARAAPVEPHSAQPLLRMPGLAQLVPAQATAVAPPITKPAIREDRRDRPAAAARPGRSAYGMGFGLALILVTGLMALYLLAPRLADQGTLGAVLTNLRDILDEARLWLQDSLGNLVG